MLDFIDENLFSIITNLDKFFEKYYTNFIGVGKAIGSILCLVVVAIEAYQMMLLKKGIDVLALLRPILIAVVITNWLNFTAGLRLPFEGLEGWASKVYNKELAIVKSKDTQRWEKQFEQYKLLQDARAKAEVASDNVKSDENIFEKLGSKVEDMFQKITDIYKVVQDFRITLQNSIMETIILYLANFIWQFAVFLTFFIKEVGLGILTITGPITFGLSVTPIWKDAWASWVSRYLSFCLYGFVAYIIMAAALQIFDYGITVDLERLTKTNLSFSTLSGITCNWLYPLLGACVGAFGLKMTPEIVTWIFPAGTSQAAQHFINGINSAASKATTKTIKASAGAAGL
ncbi:hypothetical protein [Porphyromonas levii]|uniref:Conjugative transposon TraJ C-terminal domain-containing protein n=1 Tax=Porphyromonas levii TaxID=28114 RepID=A0A4Y8WMI7_9PORP|nr:hypothetical protein [Porphyromonas levii]TFH94011.1 hypothetical protein E4P47_09340 [Porphyromonas levii]TFH96822.1 hypothetical protein E4P48_03545 [Porphyromonas levii]